MNLGVLGLSLGFPMDDIAAVLFSLLQLFERDVNELVSKLGITGHSYHRLLILRVAVTVATVITDPPTG
jgi:hypothetical protein